MKILELKLKSAVRVGVVTDRLVIGGSTIPGLKIELNQIGFKVDADCLKDRSIVIPMTGVECVYIENESVQEELVIVKPKPEPKPESEPEVKPEPKKKGKRNS